MKIKKYSIMTLCVFVSILVILNGVIAQDDSVSLPGKAADSFKCKIDFTVAYIESLSSLGANLSSYSDRLKADVAQLDSLISAGNRSAFKDFVKNFLEPDFKSTREAEHQWRKDNYRNLTKEQKTSLRASYKESKAVFEDCQKKTLFEHGNQRVELFEKILTQYKERTDRFASKGLNPEGMNKVLEDAKTQVVEPLRSAIDSTNDSQTLKNILRKYCLFNGCKNGVNYHLAARFEMERLSATLNYLKEKLNTSEFNAKFSEVESNLNVAKGILSEVASAQYNDNGKQIFNKIKSSYEILKNINREEKEKQNLLNKEENKTS